MAPKAHHDFKVRSIADGPSAPSYYVFFVLFVPSWFI
jgi:hypothetical protein